MSKPLDRAAVDRLVAEGQLITRTGLIRQADEAGEAREFTGVGVPYGEVIEHWFGTETFDRGSVEAEGAILQYGHRDTIGVITAGRDTDEGFTVDGRISDTALGRDVWTLVRDGAISKLSIGFEPIEYRVEVLDNGDEVVHWTRVRAREFSLVPFPAYEGAALDPASLRHRTDNTQGVPMPTTDTEVREQLDALAGTLEDHTRSLALLSQQTAGPVPGLGAQWRSMGEFLKALAGGDTDAADFHRAYTGATTADGVEATSFVGTFINLVDERRKLANDFTRGTLPADGMSVDYVKLGEDSTQVAEQAAQGDDLVGGKVTLVPANAPVKTYGGWTSLSRQQIERATVSTLDITLRALALKYARVTNLAVRQALLDVITAHVAADAADDTRTIDLGATLAASTADQWLTAVVDAALEFEDRGFAITRLHASRDVFKRLALLKDGDRRLMNVYGTGVNQVGELDLTAVDGNLAGVQVRLLPGKDLVDKAAFTDPVALEFLESAGAPAQLQDENIINLTKSFSLYGYAATLTPFPGAVLPIEFGV